MPRSFIKRLFRFIFFSILILSLVFIGLILFIRSPWGQSIIVNKTTSYLSKKTNSTIEIGKLFITFSGNLQLDQLYLDDLSGDTLIYSNSLEASVALLPLLMDQEINLDYLNWDGLTTKIKREADSEDFNFTFLIDAFASEQDSAAIDSSESEIPNISIGQIRLKNLTAEYDDQWLGLTSSFTLKELYFEANEINLNENYFDVEELRLNGTTLNYLQTKPLEESQESSEDTPLPSLQINQLSLADLSLNYQSVPDQMKTQLNLTNFQLDETLLNLAQQEIKSERILLDHTFLTLNIPPDSTSAPTQDTMAPETFEWPNWKMDVTQIELINNNFHLHAVDHNSQPEHFNPSFLELKALSSVLKELHYQPEDLQIETESFSFKEGEQFELKNLAFALQVSNTNAELSNLQLITPNNALQGDASLDFPSIQALLDQQSIDQISLYFPQFSLNAKDAFYFLPELKKDSLLLSLSKKNIEGQLRVQGNTQKIELSQTQLKWGNSTKIQVEGHAKNYTNTEKLSFSLHQFTAQTTQKDIVQFVTSEELGITIPKRVKLTGNASGRLDDLKAKIALTLPEGSIKANGRFSNQKQIAFDGNIALKQLALGQLLDNPRIGLVSLQAKVKGEGSTLNNLNASIDSEIDQLQLNGYDYSALKLEGAFNKGEGKITTDFKDDNLNASMNSAFLLDTLESQFDATFEVIGADLYALGLTNKRIKTAFQLQTSFDGNADDFNFHTNLSEQVIVYDSRSYSLENLTADAKSSADSSSFEMSSDFLKANMKANVPYSTLFDAIERQFTYYLSEGDTSSVESPAKMNLDFSLKESPLLTEILSQEIYFDSIQMSLDFDQSTHQLAANLSAPSISYEESSVDSILFFAEGNRERMQFSLSFLELESGMIAIPKTSFAGELKEETAFVDFNIQENEEQLMHIQSEITPTNSAILYHVNPSNLILNSKLWNILPENELQISATAILANDFELERNGNRMMINSSKLDNGKDILSLIFDNFQLSTFTSFLNTEDTLASGIIKGELAIENPRQEMGLVSDLEINRLELLGIDLGKLNLEASSQKNEQYIVNLSLKGAFADLSLDGDYLAKKEEGLLDFDFTLNRLELTELEELGRDYLSNLTGTISATARLEGTTAQPNYEGNISFQKTSATVNALNAPFKLPEESITFSTNEIQLKDFLIQDQQNNSFHLDGQILTKNLLNPQFDLSLKADRFQMLNSTIEDNDLFFGKVNLNTDLTIKGDLTIPIIRGGLSINESSRFTYIVPEEELDIMERDGIVVFVNKKNPDAILTRNEENESSSATIKGYDLNASLRVDRNVDFKIIVDQRSGDNLKIKGNGDFRVGLEPNGRTTLSGRYEVEDGYYEASLYNIVKRRFDIASGSSIVWRGNPLDAEMDLSAIYKIETSASGLMASKTSGQGVGVVNDYRQKLPFWVYLNIDGELLQPKISFQLDMPEESQGQLGGQVYSRVQQLNSQENELNKQVFSLLVLNQFFPTSSNDGTSGGSAAVARGNVNKVLEDQLNNFSNKYLSKTGLELDFGVDSYTDYQGNSPQNTTQLDLSARKKLFDDKLIIQVGSGVSIEENSGANQATTPVVGNVSLEYLFTENGRWRIKGFRKNEFESVIEGQLIVTGISLIFQREFNQFSELLEEIKKHQKQTEEPTK